MKDYFSSLTQHSDPSKNTDENKSLEPYQTPTPVSVPISPELAMVMGVVDITKEAIRCFTEYTKCREHEITERKRIAATLRAIEYQIDAQKEVYLKELDKQYEERNRLYDLAKRVQEKALDTGDKEMLQLCYNLILNVYNKPVKENGAAPSILCNFLNSSNTF